MNHRRLTSIWAFAVVALACTARTGAPSLSAPLTASSLVNVHAHLEPVMTVDTERSVPLKYGFEGGRVVKIGGTYHLFTSEMAGDPLWVDMRLGYWTSDDRLHWTRRATVRRSSANFDGTDERAALWSPMPVWDADGGRWHLFYVAYRSAPSDGRSFRLNFAGRIVHAVSETPGEDGIAGPYVDRGVIMQPGPESKPWEGLQGVNSFFPFKVGDTWYAFHGSAKTESLPVRSWLVGLAQAPALDGPWKRVDERSPAGFEGVFVENPIVTEIPGRGWACVYDSDVEGAIGWAYSANGIDWQRGTPIPVAGRGPSWGKDVRTPLGLVAEGENRYTVFYTAFESAPQWETMLEKASADVTCAVGFLEVELRP